MGRRGPKPEAASVKKQKGNPGRRPIGSDPLPTEIKKNLAGASAVAAPTWLNGEGLKIWNRLSTMLVGQNLLAQIDAEAFGRYCQNFARWLKMQKVLDDQGETYETESPHGTYLRANPAVGISDRLERQLLSAESNFGLNPAERQRLFAARAAGSLGDLFGKPIAEGGEVSPSPQAAPKATASGYLLN